MTSLIDVIFLLLLFFMLTSTFSKYGEIELTAAGQGSAGDSEAKPHFLSLQADRMLLNGVAVAPEDLPNSLQPDADGADRLVLISLADETTSQTLVDTLALLRGISGVRTVVLQ